MFFGPHIGKGNIGLLKKQGRKEVSKMTEVVADVLNNVGYLLVYVGVFVLLVNIGAAIKSMGDKM